MQRRRTQILLGGFIIPVAVSMITDVSPYFSWPFLSLGIFLLVWGVFPAAVKRGIGVLPGGELINGRLGKADRWLAGDADARETLDRLSYKLDDGLEILNRPVKSEEEFYAWEADQKDWFNGVFSEIETNFSRAQAVTFRAVGSVLAADMPPAFNAKHNRLKLHLNKRINNLRNFLDAESGKL